MQIAKMFASLGFKVDTTGLQRFKTSLAGARSEITSLGRGTKQTTRQLRGLANALKNVDQQLGRIRGAAATSRVQQGYNQMAASVRRVDTALNSITRNRPAITQAIGKINSSVLAGVPHWERYRNSVVQTRRALRNLNRDLARLRANSRVDIRIRNTGGNGNGGGRGGSGGGAGAGGLGGAAAGLGLRGFLGNILPSIALSGVGAGVGYGAVAAVEAARAQTRMENTLLLTSKSAGDLADTIAFVKTEALRLGLTSVELGKSFSQMNLSAKTLSKDQKKEMFTGFSEFMVAMGTNKEGQKGILKAYNQMFALGKVSQEEINQLSEHGIPATLVYDAAMKAHDLDSIKAVKALQQDGGLVPEKVLLELSKDMKNLANNSGALAKAMESSQFKQNVFMESLKQSSKNIMDGGLDVQLGRVFEVLTDVVFEVEKLATVISASTKEISKISAAIKETTGVSSILQAVLGILIFRYKKIWLGAKRAFIVLRSGGMITRALGELFTGILGPALKMLILRFGGLIGVLYLAQKAYSFLYAEIKKGEMGDWTFFDTLALRAEKVVLQVKLLIAQMKWLKTYVSSGAMANDGAMEVGKLAKDKLIDLATPKETINTGFKTVLEIMSLIDKYSGGDKKSPSASGTPFISEGQGYRDTQNILNFKWQVDIDGQKVGEGKEVVPAFMGN